MISVLIYKFRKMTRAEYALLGLHARKLNDASPKDRTINDRDPS